MAMNSAAVRQQDHVCGGGCCQPFDFRQSVAASQIRKIGRKKEQVHAAVLHDREAVLLGRGRRSVIAC
jgi:hypothetical protein